MTTPEVAKAPALFLRNATGLVKGWSAFDAFGYSFFSVNLVTLGMFYSLAIFAFVPDGSVLSALVLSGVTMTFLCIVYAGLIAVDAAGRRRLRLADADLRRGPRRDRRGGGRRAHRLPRCERVRSRRHDRDHRRRRRRGHRPGPRHAARRDRLRPVQHGLVVHPRAVGADLRLHPQHRVPPAARGDRGRHRPAHVPRVAGRDVHRLDHHDHHRLRCGRPGHGRLRPDPAGEHLHRPHRAGRDVHPDDRLVTGHVQGRLRSGRPEPVRCLERLPGDDRQRGRQRRIRARRVAARLRARDRNVAAPAVHDVLDPVPELGRDPVRRGPRRGRLPEGPQRDARRSVGHDRPGDRLRAARLEDVRLGLLQRRRTSTSSTTRTATSPSHRRYRSGAIRRCWRRS